MPEIPPCCVHRLQGDVEHGLSHQGTTHDAPRLVNDDEFPFHIMVDDFHRLSGDGGFVPVHDVPELDLQSHAKYYGRVKTPNSIRSPFRIIVSGLAISPLIVVTPDARAYLWAGTLVLFARVASSKNSRTYIVVYRSVPEFCGYNL